MIVLLSGGHACPGFSCEMQSGCVLFQCTDDFIESWTKLGQTPTSSTFSLQHRPKPYSNYSGPYINLEKPAALNPRIG